MAMSFVPISCLLDEIKTLARTLCKEGSSVAYSLQPNRTEHFLQHIVVLADMSCPGIHAFLVKASHQGYFKSPYRWLIVDEHSRDLGLLETLEMPVNSDVVIARRLGDDILFIEAYRISEKFSVIYTPRSKWRPLTTYPKKYFENSINSLLHHVDDEFTINTIDEYQNLTNGDEEKLTKEDLLKTNENSAIKSNEGLTKIKINEELTNAIDAAKNRKLVTTIVTINKYGVIEDFRETRVLVIRRKNLRKHVLTMANVVTDTNETRLHLSDRLQLNQDSITKMSYSVVTICFDMLNSTEHLLFTHTWGYKDKNGNWQGIIDHLLKKEADLGTLTIFTQDRMSAIDYIAMVGSTKVRFIFREPPLAYISNIFAMPFTGAVWLAILICVLGCAVFLYITSKWEAMMHSHPLQLDGSWADVLILIIGAVLQQGCTLEPRQAAGRCVTLLLFVALTILYAAYSANIVVLLRAPSSSVRTLKDLLNSPLELGASDFEYNRYFFKKLNEPLRKEIYDKKIAPKGKKPHFYSMKEGVAKIRKGLFAFHMEPNPGYRLIQETYQEDEKCDLVEIDYINEIDPWVPGQKRSPFKDLFRINFLKIRESGIQLCVFQRLQVPRPKCSGSISSFSSVGITDMYPAMLMTLYGMLMAPAVLVLEIAYKQLLTLREKRKMRKEFHNEP